MNLLSVMPREIKPANDVEILVRQYADKVRAARAAYLSAKDDAIGPAKTAYLHALVAHFTALDMAEQGVRR